MDVKGAIEKLKAWIDANESGPFHNLVADALEAIHMHLGSLAPAPVAPDESPQPAVDQPPAVAPSPAEAATDVEAQP